jgi:carbon monoxide dehydrogenase subunit G
MARFETTIDVPTPPTDVFAYLADLTNAARWDPNVVEAQRLDEGPLGIGARFRLLTAFYGRRIELTYAIEMYEPDRHLTIRAEAKSAQGHDDITIDASDAGSRIGYVSELRLTGLLRAFDRGFQLAFTGICERATAGLRQALGA